MKKLALIYGSLAGIVCIGMFFVNNPPSQGFDPDNLKNGELIGYTTMLISLSTIFLATKQYRDKELGGTIKFGKALLLGLSITAVAGLFYVVGWEVYQSMTPANFMEQYMEYEKGQMLESGKTQEEVDAYFQSQAGMMELYQNNTPFRMGITFLEIFPVGLLISLINGLVFGVILKPKK